MADFRYCLNSSTIKPTPILKKIEIAGKVGYDGIELWHDDIDAYLSEGGQLNDLRKAVDDQGLEVPTTIMLKGWFDTAGQDYEEAMTECRRRMEQSVALRARFAIAGPPHGRVDFAQGARRYRTLLQTGIDLGVRPAMEYLGFAEEVNTIADALRIMDESGHPEATIVLDPFHCFRGGGGMDDIRRLTAERVAISHFNDAPTSPPREQQRDPDRVMPGDGHLDLKHYCDLLREIGYTRHLSLELFRQDLWDQDPEHVARIGLERMRAAAES